MQANSEKIARALVSKLSQRLAELESKQRLGKSENREKLRLKALRATLIK